VTLDELIREFQSADEQGVAAFWRKADAALTIRTQFPNGGLRTLRERTRYDRRNLTRLVKLARVFPADQRDLSLSPTHHREAVVALTHFPVGSREHDPQHRLRLARAEGWTAQQLRHALRNTLPATPSVEDRETRAQRRFEDAKRLFAKITALHAQFSQNYAAIWGTELVLSERALPLQPAS
jgi:hypothetical protein